MQIDIVQIGYGLLILFITGAVTALFAYIYKRSGGAIQASFSRSDSEFQVAIRDCVHTEESGMFIYSMTMDISNNTTSTMRVKGITVRDGSGQELEFVTRGHTSPNTEFEIRGGDTAYWTGFCQGEFPKRRYQEQTKLKLEIERIGHRTLKMNIVSTLVSKGKFPTGEIIRVL